MSLTVTQDHVVSLSYRLTVAGNAVEDGTIEYLHGHGNIVPGLEAGLDGAAIGQDLHVEVPPALGYGDRVEDAVQQVPRSLFPAGMDIRPGMQFHARAPDGTGVPVWVLHVDDSFIVVDANHPMAGATLLFDVTIRAIRPGTAEEIAHGHMHGPDGHGHGHDH